MDRPAGTEPRDDAITSGSDTRPSRDLAEPQVLDVAAEAQSLFDEPEWGERDRNSRTIARTERLRITLTALRAGSEIGSDSTDDTLAVQVLRGRATIDAGGGATEVREGQLGTVPEAGTWRVRADEDALLLLTVALGSGGRNVA